MTASASLSYYPGCSLAGTAAGYDDTVRLTAEILGLTLVELTDWSCCGASSAHAMDHDLGVSLPARNLRIASREGRELLVPCSACFNRLAGARAALRADPLTTDCDEARVELLHLSTLLARPLSLRAMRDAVAEPLENLPVACYHGCLSLRPPALTCATSHEQPRTLAEVVKTLGATPVRWSHATECCGGSLAMTRPDIVERLVGEIVTAARRAGARAIVTDCPMCQANVESRQTEPPGGGAKLPAFFVTELVVAAASKHCDRVWWRGHLVDPLPALTGSTPP